MSLNVQLFIDGEWTSGSGGRQKQVINPATGDSMGTVAVAETSDLEKAVAAADRAFKSWSRMPAMERYKLMRKTAAIVEQRVDETARAITLENGKPITQSEIEVRLAAEVIEWCAEEAKRVYGRVIPSRADGIHQFTSRQPVGPVAAFSPWNFPLNQAVRKISAALAAGCTIVIKCPEETPRSCAMLIQCFADAGIPDGVVNLVYGEPAEISSYLIPHPAIRKISFTGSTAVGKQLASLAGLHMKQMTMELGGHAPVIIDRDADIEFAVATLSAQKTRNSGQVCTAPTRFMVQEQVFDNFLERFTDTLSKVKVGDGLDRETQMGPLANDRRLQAMEEMVADAENRGASIATGGRRIGNKGYFFEPTILVDVPQDAMIMNVEPFGPIAPVNRFSKLEDALEEANRLPYGLAAYGYSRSAEAIGLMGSRIEAGTVSINHNGVALPEVPFGGIKDSGYGSEGGLEAIEAYLVNKFVTQKMY